MKKAKTKKIIISVTVLLLAVILIISIVGSVIYVTPKAYGYKPLGANNRESLMCNFDAFEEETKAEPKRTINNENPVNLINYYGHEPLETFWFSLDEDYRKYSVLLIIPSHIFLPDYSAQTLEQIADECEELKIPYVIQNTMGEAFAEELMPIGYLEKRFASKHKYFYGLNCAELYNGENWRGDADSDYTQYVCDSIKLCAKYGCFFFWTDTNLFYENNGMLMDWLERSELLYSTLKEYSKYVYMLNKETAAIVDLLPIPSTYSLMEGLWLSGLIGGWGVACDWWTFDINQIDGKASLFHEYDEYIDHYSENGFSYPENMFTMAFVYVASRGGCCFSAEAPNMTMAVGGKTVPGYEYSILPFFKDILKGRYSIPGKRDVLDETKAVILGSENYPTFVYNTYESYRYPANPLINIIPLLPKDLRLEERAVFEEQGILLIEKNENEEFYKSLFDEIEANTYITRTVNQWYYLNNVENQSAEKSAKIYPVISSAETVSLTTREHTYAIIKEKSNCLEFSINNYRTDKSALLKAVNSESTDNWVEIADEYLELDEDGNPVYLDDSEKRKTVIAIKGSLNGGKPNTEYLNAVDYGGRYNRDYEVQEEWDEVNSVLTLTFMHNGRINFNVYLDDSNKNYYVHEKRASLEATKTKSNNSVEKLEALTAEYISDSESYTPYSYMIYNRCFEKARVMINEGTYSNEEINSCADELEKAKKNLVNVEKYVSLLREVLNSDSEEFSPEEYDELMRCFDNLLFEILSPKFYVEGILNRDVLSLSEPYKNLKVDSIQIQTKRMALELRYNQLEKAYKNALMK